MGKLSTCRRRLTITGWDTALATCTAIAHPESEKQLALGVANHR